ncbi:hypothetical protein AURDEDRAFT_177341 [Auricularia subglabra TFB-10046 SS5]|uniref:Uncharacterized protein n=1 Tax=Auricularia subglabra (strain TFB-10046 / SS5) TaxID=717982 RepID=J0CTE9_AURST|nr:hypothetical protein AURDEDRAFT_177341 [Auricularia subglabra TFB-10046 SS5]
MPAHQQNAAVADDNIAAHDGDPAPPLLDHDLRLIAQILSKANSPSSAPFRGIAYARSCAVGPIGSAAPAAAHVAPIAADEPAAPAQDDEAAAPAAHAPAAQLPPADAANADQQLAVAAPPADAGPQLPGHLDAAHPRNAAKRTTNKKAAEHAAAAPPRNDPRAPQPPASRGQRKREEISEDDPFETHDDGRVHKKRGAILRDAALAPLTPLPKLDSVPSEVEMLSGGPSRHRLGCQLDRIHPTRLLLRGCDPNCMTARLAPPAEHHPLWRRCTPQQPKPAPRPPKPLEVKSHTAATPLQEEFKYVRVESNISRFTFIRSKPTFVWPAGSRHRVPNPAKAEDPQPEIPVAPLDPTAPAAPAQDDDELEYVDKEETLEIQRQANERRAAEAASRMITSDAGEGADVIVETTPSSEQAGEDVGGGKENPPAPQPKPSKHIPVIFIM